MHRRISRVSIMNLSVPADSKSRRNSLIDTITSTKPAGRKDSIISTLDYEPRRTNSSTSSIGSVDSEKSRRLSRKLSLKPPSSIYRERRESFPRKVSDGAVFLRQATSGGLHHTIVCECGKEIRFQCRYLSASSVPSITLSGAEVTELKKAITDKTADNRDRSSSGTTKSEPDNQGHLKLQDIIDDLRCNINDYDKVLRRCIEIGKVEDQDSLEVVLSRQNTIKSLLMALKRYPGDRVLQQEAWKSLLIQVQLSACNIAEVRPSTVTVASLLQLRGFGRPTAIEDIEGGTDSCMVPPLDPRMERMICGDSMAELWMFNLVHYPHLEVSLHYVSMNDGIEALNKSAKAHPDDVTLLATILDIVCYFSSQDEWRVQLTEKINQSYFLTTMARHENDAVIVEKCCIIIGNLVLSEDLARSLMYVGGVHSIISMLTKYSKHTTVLRHCCAALGTFASHDDTCQAVAEAGATKAVMDVMKSYHNQAEIQESCCWAIASLSRSDAACNELLQWDIISVMLDVMETYCDVANIQEYGCWALCNLVALGSKLDDKDSKSAMEVLITCMKLFVHNVELQEHVCFAINALVTFKPCVHETFVRSDGINSMIELMRTYEDSDDIQINASKIIGNLAVHDEFRYYLEDVGSSEAVISCMLKIEKNQSIQLTGCMALTNLSADLADNKYRILKNGGVNAVLQAMKTFMDDESIQLNALKLLCNLMESDKGCWWIAEESGIQVITMTLKKFLRNQEILSYGCSCLGNLPRRGVNAIALESVESTLLYLRQRESGSVEIARGVCVFYENILKTDGECKKLFNKTSMETVVGILHECDDIDVLISGCRIVTLVALGDHMDMITKDVTSVVLSIMRQHPSNCNIQLIGCGAISYLSGSVDGIESLSELDCIEAILDALKLHQDEQNLHNVGLIALENVCKADLVRGMMIQSVCDVVSLSMKSHPFDREIQEAGCNILSIIGTGFHKQNVLRRQSMDTLEPVVGVFKRKSVTEEILEIASSALQRVIKFKDEMMEDSEESEGLEQSTELNIVVNDSN